MPLNIVLKPEVNVSYHLNLIAIEKGVYYNITLEHGKGFYTTVGFVGHSCLGKRTVNIKEAQIN